MIDLQSAINKTTFEVLHNAPMMSKMQQNLGCVRCHWDFSISGDVI